MKAYLSVISQIRLKPKGLYDGQLSLHNEDGGPWLRPVLGHMASPLGQHCVDGLYTICRRQARVKTVDKKKKTLHF